MGTLSMPAIVCLLVFWHADDWRSQLTLSHWPHSFFKALNFKSSPIICYFASSNKEVFHCHLCFPGQTHEEVRCFPTTDTTDKTKKDNGKKKEWSIVHLDYIKNVCQHFQPKSCNITEGTEQKSIKYSAYSWHYSCKTPVAKRNETDYLQVGMYHLVWAKLPFS